MMQEEQRQTNREWAESKEGRKVHRVAQERAKLLPGALGRAAVRDVGDKMSARQAGKYRRGRGLVHALVRM